MLTDFSSALQTSDGQCLFVDELSGDFRANLTPIQIGACDGSDGQLWDVLTSGVHNNVPGSMLVVSTLVGAPHTNLICFKVPITCIPYLT